MAPFLSLALCARTVPSRSRIRPRGTVPAGGPDPHPPLDDDEEQPEDRDHADDAELLAERREREVGMDFGDRRVAGDLGESVPEADAEQPAARERVKPLNDLIAGTERVREGIEPDVEARPDIGEHLGHQDASDDEQDETGE